MVMKTSTSIQPTNIDYYLDTVEHGILMSDAESIKKICEQTSRASSRIEDVEQHLDSEGQREARILRAAIDEMQVQLALGKMDAVDKVEEMEKRIEQGYSQMKHAVSRLERLGEGQAEALRDKIHNSWIHLKAAGTIARLRLELAEEKSEAKLQAAKDELIADFEKIRDLAKESVDDACEKSAEWIDNTKKSVGGKAHNILKAIKS